RSVVRNGSRTCATSTSHWAALRADCARRSRNPEGRSEQEKGAKSVSVDTVEFILEKRLLCFAATVLRPVEKDRKRGERARGAQPHRGDRPNATFRNCWGRCF